MAQTSDFLHHARFEGKIGSLSFPESINTALDIWLLQVSIGLALHMTNSVIDKPRTATQRFLGDTTGNIVPVIPVPGLKDDIITFVTTAID